jgi:hypothetical protein
MCRRNEIQLSFTDEVQIDGKLCQPGLTATYDPSRKRMDNNF